MCEYRKDIPPLREVFSDFNDIRLDKAEADLNAAGISLVISGQVPVGQMGIPIQITTLTSAFPELNMPTIMRAYRELCDRNVVMAVRNQPAPVATP